MDRKGSFQVILGDGGIKSLAVLPILRFLKENHIQIEKITGCGGGATLAALIALKVPFSEMVTIMGELYHHRLVSRLNLTTIAKLLKCPFLRPHLEDAVLSDQLFKEELKKTFENVRVEDLPIPLSIQATLFHKAERKSLTSGNLADALYASNALYPLFAPICLDDEWLVAGSFLSTLPLLDAAKSGKDAVLAIHIDRSGEFFFKNKIDFLITVMTRSCVADQTFELKMAEELLKDNLTTLSIRFERAIGMWEDQAICDILEAGEQALSDNSQALVRLLRVHGDPPSQFGGACPD